MSGSIELGITSSSASSTAVATIADCAIADYSHHVAGELAIVSPDAHRDDLNLVGHRATELTLDEAAA